MASPSHAAGYPQYDAQVLLNSQPVIVTVIDPSTHQIFTLKERITHYEEIINNLMRFCSLSL